MTTRICLLLIAILALPATAAAKGDSPPVPPTPVLSSTLAGYTTALRSQRVRRGLALPSLRRLFGKAGARAQALADARLTAPPAKAASAHAAANRGMTRVGSIGRVRVSATAAPGLGAGVDQIAYTDRIKGPFGTQTRSIRFTATAAECPIAAERTNNVGKSVGNLLAAEHIVTVVRSRGLKVTTDFTIDTTGSREIWGLVNGRAELTYIEPKPTAYARIRRVRTTRDLRTGRTYREKPLELTYELQMTSPLAMQGNGDFDRFIAEATNDTDRADAVVSDRLLNQAAFHTAAQTFMLAVEAKTRAVFARAEQLWRTPNHCVELHSNAPRKLLPGQSVKVHVSATSKRGDPPANLRSYARYVPRKSADLGVAPFATVEPDQNAAHDFTITPPSQAWPDTSQPRLQILFYSTGGIGEVDADFEADTMPIRYRILSASFTTHSKGSEPGGKCASLGGTSGWVTLKGGSAGVVQDQEYSTLDTRWSGGVLSGQIFAKAATTISDGASGCEYDSNWQLQPCSWTSNDFALPNPFAVGFSVRVPDPASGEAIVHWQVHSPGIGDTATVKCDVAIYHHVPYDTTTRKVPLAQLLSSEPQTYSYGDSIHFDQDDQGHAASIDYDWTYTLTVQRY